VKKPNIVGMKDSHRTTQAFMNLQKIVRGKISVFVNQTQFYPYYEMGAAAAGRRKFGWDHGQFSISSTS